MSNFRKKISMQDIGDKLNISKNAVSLALNNKPGVSEELRKMVFKTAENLNYPGIIKENRDKNKNILVIIKGEIVSTNTFYNEIFWSIEKQAKECGYNAIITTVNSSMEKELRLPEIFFDVKFGGALVLGIFDTGYILEVEKTGLPIVLVDSYYDELAIDSVVTANLEGAYRIVKYLIDNGHEKIGFIRPEQVTSSFYERWCGYNKAMFEHDLKIEEKYCKLDTSPLNESNSIVLEQYIDSLESYPTAWFCAHDRIAITLIGILDKKKIRVPENISVVGFDDVESAVIVSPALTTIHVKREIIGKKAIDMLINKIQKHGYDYINGSRICVYGELVIRDSVKRIK